MFDLKTVFLTLSVAIAFVTFIPYVIEIRRGTAKPHVFSWATWGVLTGLGFVLSQNGGGGEGSWVFAFMSVDCFAVAAVGLWQGAVTITRADQVAFACAMVATVFYAFTRNATVSVILAAGIDTCGFVPTFRKSFAKPFSEPLLPYLIAPASYLFSILALSTLSFVTVLYPLVLVVTNLAFVAFLVVRRRAIRP